MPGRRIIGGYRYAYQGQEKDPETGKEAFQLRLWDGRIGRWLTTDPARQFSSPYIGMGNNPISSIDPDGGTCVDADNNPITCPEGYGAFSGPTVDTGVFDNGKFVGYQMDEITITSYGGIQAPSTSVQNLSFTNNIDNNPEIGVFSAILSLEANNIYNKDFWRGKNGKYYSTDWGGNGSTGGKFNYAKSTSKYLNRLGGALGLYGAYSTNDDYINNRITTGRMVQDQAFNGAGYLGPVGAAASLGYSSGSLIEDLCNCNIQINWQNVRRHGLDLHKMFEPVKGRDY